MTEQQLQDEPRTMPCFKCHGKGSFLIVDRPDGYRYVYEHTVWNKQKFRPEHTAVFRCGECDGKGEVDAPELKR